MTYPDYSHQQPYPVTSANPNTFSNQLNSSGLNVDLGNYQLHDEKHGLDRLTHPSYWNDGGHNWTLDGNAVVNDLRGQSALYNKYFESLSPQQQQALVQGISQGKIGVNGDFASVKAQQDAYLTNLRNSQWTTRDTIGAVQSGIGAVAGLVNIYQSFKNAKLAKRNLQNQENLHRANYAAQAKEYNNNIRNLGSGRGLSVQSRASVNRIGEETRRRLISETY